MKKEILIIILLSLVVSKCTAQSTYHQNGGVYVSEKLINNRSLDLDSIYPIVALRIDTIINDTVLIKYRLGMEYSMDIDYVYDKSCKCYTSNDKILFSPMGEIKDYINIKLLDEKILLLIYKGEEFRYKLTYINKVNISTHRDI